MGSWTPGLNATELREKAWEKLVELQPQPEVALLQEARAPPARLGLDSQVGSGIGDARRLARRMVA
jgi:hypothetical protein